ncbi:hypothetical protein Hanom_Chr04g00330661 [Helianthus anomalus]
MGITFLKSSSIIGWYLCMYVLDLCSSRKCNNIFSGFKYIQRNKPYFCELYLTSGGRLFYLKERNN